MTGVKFLFRVTLRRHDLVADIFHLKEPVKTPLVLSKDVADSGSNSDNALAETINGLYKAEVIHWLGPWKNIASVEWETLKWVDWFNNRRLLEPIGYILPAEAEERYYAQFNALDMVA
jgi:putative transposase